MPPPIPHAGRTGVRCRSHRHLEHDHHTGRPPQRRIHDRHAVTTVYGGEIGESEIKNVDEEPWISILHMLYYVYTRKDVSDMCAQNEPPAVAAAGGSSLPAASMGSDNKESIT